MTQSKTFAELGARPETAAALASKGITHAFEIQQTTLPLALQGLDLIGQAKTGTGKTLGFAIPIIDRVISPQDPEWAALAAKGKPQALILTPTRELCLQVAEDLKLAGSTRGVRTLAIYGGVGFEPQIAAITRGVEVIIATPGRVIDLVQRGTLKLNAIRILCLDEADQMLDFGFLPDIERILRQIPSDRQTMLFSATMPREVLALAKNFMHEPTYLRVHGDDDESETVSTVTQFAYLTHPLDKPEMVGKILQAEGRGPTIIFCRTKHGAQRTCDDLVERGFSAGSIHGDMSQEARERSMAALRSGKINILVATDVAARGIDIDGVTHVINYQVPENEKTYLHRIGRTGRAGASGTAITFVDHDTATIWKVISNTLDLELSEPAETYSSSAHLHTDLNIPEGTRSRLRTAPRPSSEKTRSTQPADRPHRTPAKARATGAEQAQERSPRTRTRRRVTRAS